MISIIKELLLNMVSYLFMAKISLYLSGKLPAFVMVFRFQNYLFLLMNVFLSFTFGEVFYLSPFLFCYSILQMLSSKDLNFVGYTYKNFEIINDYQVPGMGVSPSHHFLLLSYFPL